MMALSLLRSSQHSVIPTTIKLVACLMLSINAFAQDRDSSASEEFNEIVEIDFSNYQFETINTFKESKNQLSTFRQSDNENTTFITQPRILRSSSNHNYHQYTLPTNSFIETGITPQSTNIDEDDLTSKQTEQKKTSAKKQKKRGRTRGLALLFMLAGGGAAQ